MSTADKNSDVAPKGSQPKRRGWFRRNWRRIVLLLLSILIAGAGALYWNFFLRVYNLQVCRDAMKAIAADKAMQDILGRPIKDVLWPSQETIPAARISEDEIDVIWSIEGPKKQARAHLNARKRQGRWDIVMLEVTPAGGKRTPIHQADEGADEPPPFQVEKPETKTETKKPETKSPEIKINVPGLPDDAPAGGK